MAMLAETTTQVCPGCGAEVAGTLAICPECGRTLVNRPSARIVAEQYAPAALLIAHRRTNWAGLVIVLLILALALAAFGFGMFPRQVAALKADLSQFSASLQTAPEKPVLGAAAVGKGPLAGIVPAKVALLSFTSKLVDKGATAWKFRYTIRLGNGGKFPGLANVRVKFLDASGVTLAEETKIGLLIPAGEKKEFQDEKDLAPDVAARVAKVEGKLI
jgi:hypothetical protein